MKNCYKVFIEETPGVLAIRRKCSDISTLFRLHAIINRMRVISARNTVESADNVARMIINSYRAPNKTLPELHNMVNRGAIDVLQTFSEAAREEFHRLGV